MKPIMTLISILLLLGCSSYNPGRNIPIERQREYATALFNQQLYIQSITEYDHLLNWYNVDDETKANINYTIGNIFLEQMGDYSNSLAYYLRVKYLYPKSKVTENNNKKIVACFERLGKPAEAEAFMKGTPTSLSKSDSPFERIPGDTVAIVAGEIYTIGEIERLFNYYYNTLPVEQRKATPTNDDKLAFLREYIRSEVLYNSAKRQGLDAAKDVTEVAYLLKKDLMVKKLLDNEVYNKVTVTDAEIEKYYSENKDKLKQQTPEGKTKQLTLDESKNIIQQYLILQKGQVLKEQLTDKLIEAQNARVFLDKIK
jgi:hypothetical protein